jgi:hypothetical protein
MGKPWQPVKQRWKTGYGREAALIRLKKKSKNIMGSFWYSKPDYVGRGRGTLSITIKGYKQNFMMLDNPKTEKKSPDYVFVALGEPKWDKWRMET